MTTTFPEVENRSEMEYSRKIGSFAVGFAGSNVFMCGSCRMRPVDPNHGVCRPCVVMINRRAIERQRLRYQLKLAAVIAVGGVVVLAGFILALAVER